MLYTFQKTHTYTSEYDSSQVFFNIQENNAISEGGDAYEYFTMDIQTRSYVYYQGGTLMTLEFTASNIIQHYQTSLIPVYTLPSPRRNMATYTNADGTTTTNTTVKAKEETKEMAIYYRIFFTISNMGGLYAFLMLIAGIFMRPILNGMFNVDIVNDAHQANQKGLSMYSSLTPLILPF